MARYALSMTTIPRRFDFLTKTCFPSIAESVARIRQVLDSEYGSRIEDFVLTLDDNIQPDDFSKYENWARTVNTNQQSGLRVTIRQDNHEYRCINKELGGIEFCRANGLTAFITLDDDQVYNDHVKFLDLCRYSIAFPDDVVCVETNPVVASPAGIDIVCGLPPKIAALRSHSKILSNFCLFPANCFDGTRIADLDYIRKLEWNKHDELLAWAELTRKGVTSIVLPNTYSLAWDNFDGDYTGDDHGLRDYNTVHWNDWTAKINECYPEFKFVMDNEKWEYIVDDSNAYAVGLLRANGILNSIAAQLKKVVVINTDLLRSTSYRKFMFGGR